MNQEIKIKIKEIALISLNLTEISMDLQPYFLRIAEISIKPHKQPSYFLVYRLCDSNLICSFLIPKSPLCGFGRASAAWCEVYIITISYGESKNPL